MLLISVIVFETASVYIHLASISREDWEVTLYKGGQKKSGAGKH